MRHKITFLYLKRSAVLAVIHAIEWTAVYSIRSVCISVEKQMLSLAVKSNIGRIVVQHTDLQLSN